MVGATRTFNRDSVRDTQSMTIKTPGTQAPDLHITDAHGNNWSLADYRGDKRVVLALLRGLW